MVEKIKNISLQDISRLSEKVTLYALFLNAALFSVNFPFSHIMGVSVCVFIIADILLLIRFLQKKEE
jgi:hypothetical protein